MMGTQARLFTPLPAVTLEELVPADHFYRHLDRVLDLSFVRDLVQDRYAAGVGRPSVDPRVFFKLQLVMFFEGIRSEWTCSQDTGSSAFSVKWMGWWCRVWDRPKAASAYHPIGVFLSPHAYPPQSARRPGGRGCGGWGHRGEEHRESESRLGTCCVTHMRVRREASSVRQLHDSQECRLVAHVPADVPLAPRVLQ
jgi:hypothetical protein